MAGYNHYLDCVCGWCVNYGRARSLSPQAHDAAHARAALERYRCREASFASYFVNPNANCPICGPKVFFYANATGSRVYFDDLGWPWPKHACTDVRKGYGVWAPRQDHPPFSRRTSGEIDDIRDQLILADGPDLRVQRAERFGSEPEAVFIVEACTRRGFENLVSARELVGGQGSSIGLRFTAAKFEPRVGDLFSFNGEQVSFFMEGTGARKRYRAVEDPTTNPGASSEAR